MTPENDPGSALAADRVGHVGADAEICGLLLNALSINALFLWRVHKIQPENNFLFVGQNDMKRVAVIPPLGLINAAVQPLDGLRRRSSLPGGNERHKHQSKKRDWLPGFHVALFLCHK